MVLIMEVDKVVDEVTDMVIDDTHGDDVRGGDWGAGHGGWQGGR